MSTHEGPGEPRSRVREVSLPADMRALAALERIDYTDAFVVEGVPARTAEQWARAVLEDTPPPGKRARLVLGWTALGLRLGSPWSERTVLGWTIVQRSPDLVVLAAGSRFGLAGTLLFRREPHGLLYATLAQQDNRVARAVWARIAPDHRHVVGSLLTDAARRENERERRGQRTC